MLTHLTLINFALADHLALDIASGFNVLTGETGAGKSLLLDAISACLGERIDSNLVRFGTEKADISAIFSYQENAPEALWLNQKELLDDSGEIHLRRVIFVTGRSKAWINGRPTSLSELKELGRLLVQLYSQHSQQQLLAQAYPKQWLDHATQLAQPVQSVRQAHQIWQQTIQQHQDALRAQATKKQKIQQLEQQLEDLESISQQNYTDIEQEFDRFSHHEAIMQDSAYSLNLLDEAEPNVTQVLANVVKRLEAHINRSTALQEIYTTLTTAQSEINDASFALNHFINQQSFDPERMQQLNNELEVFHRLARKYRTQPEQLKAQYNTWQAELNALLEQEDPATLEKLVSELEADFFEKARHLDQIRQQAAPHLAQQLTTQVKTLALPEAHFEFKFEPLEQASAEGLSRIQLLFTANKGIPPQPLAKVASGGELSRIALVMQVMNAKRTEAEMIVFDEIDVGISGGTAEIVGRLLSKLGQHVQILCITHQAQVAAQSDQHLFVEKQQTDPASSHIFQLNETQCIHELARMTGGIEINQTTLKHAQQLRALKFQQHK